jgi:hypothetical protein
MLTIDKEKRPNSKTILEKLEELRLNDSNIKLATLNVNTIQ